MDKQYITNLTQKIINKSFSTSVEKKTILHEDRVNFRCPYCGEGRTKSKKRGNVYFNRLLYICFRCDKKTSFDKFTKDFNEQIDPNKKLEMIEYLDSVVSYNDYENDFIDAKFDSLINLDDIKLAIERNVTPLSDFKPVVENSGVYKYLTKRGITKNLQKNIYQAKFWLTDDIYHWVIVMLNRKGNNVIGVQVRNLKGGKNRMFKIYNYENIREWVSLIKEVPDMDMNQIIVYNKLSYYFNILNVNFDKMITVFEGYLDSLFYPNSIGLVGVNTDHRFIEDSGFDIQYFFDNDYAGHKKTEEKLKNGIKVFLWNKLFEDIVDKKKSNDPYRLKHKISKVKDLNKLNELVNNSYKKLELYNYFSDDIYDIRWVPKNIWKDEYDEIKDYNKKFKNFDNL